MSTEEQLSLFAEDSPVSHSVLPGSKEAHKMIAHSGLRCCELYRKWLPDGSLAKMFLESSRWNSTRCYLTWRSRVTPAGRLLFQLAPSMPTTGEIESGLLGTPTAIYKVRSERFREGRSPNPAEYALMHTPTATANQMAPSMQKHVGSWWRTPSADQGGTPKALLEGKTTRPSGHKIQIRLQDQVRMCPTPTARDYKGGRKKATLEESGRGATNSLNDFLTMQEEHGSLNPTWVEWLMGFPIGHTDLKPSVTQ